MLRNKNLQRKYVLGHIYVILSYLSKFTGEKKGIWNPELNLFYNCTNSLILTHHNEKSDAII